MNLQILLSVLCNSYIWTRSTNCVEDIAIFCFEHALYNHYYKPALANLYQGSPTHSYYRPEGSYLFGGTLLQVPISALLLYGVHVDVSYTNATAALGSRDDTSYYSSVYSDHTGRPPVCVSGRAVHITKSGMFTCGNFRGDSIDTSGSLTHIFT